MGREPAAETAARVGCSLDLIALHERTHACWDGVLYTRPPCLLTDPDRYRHLLAVLAITDLVLPG